MNTFKNWFIETHPGLLDRGKCLLDGTEVGFGIPNNPRLAKAIRDHYNEGQRVMAPFVKWLVRHEGLREKAARMTAASVFNALCVTHDAQEGSSHPEKLFESPAYSRATLTHIQGHLRRWALYTKDPELTARINEIMNRGKVTHVVHKARTMQAEPYTVAEIDAVLEAVETLRQDPRWPWGWPVMRLIVVGGARATEIHSMTRTDLLRSRTSGMISSLRQGQGVRSIPVQLVRDEVEQLLAWPWSWSTVTDIIAPRTADAAQVSSRQIWRLAQHVFGLAGVECSPRSWVGMLRWAAALRYYAITKNLLGTTHLIGAKHPGRVEGRLQVLGERQRERAARLARGLLVEEAESGAGGDDGQEAVEG